MNYDKLIIVDFDDTLCMHPPNDSTNIMLGKPNVPLIEKLNDLHSKGYRVEIYTARGHYSCKTRAEAETKYRNVIIQWLHDNKVKFDWLSFNKPFGIIYIDDKAVRPDELDRLDLLT